MPKRYSVRRRYQRQLLHHLPPDRKSDQRAGPMCRRPPAFLRHRPCQRGHLLIRRSDRSSQRCMGARPASTSNRQSSRRLRQGLLQRSGTPHTHDEHQELHHRLRIELLGRPGRAISHPSPLERAPEQFHLSREERNYLRQPRYTQTHCRRQYLHRLQKRRTGPPGHRRHIPEGFSGRRLLQQRRHQLEWIRFEQLLGEQCRVFRHHSAQDTRPRLARLADPEEYLGAEDAAAVTDDTRWRVRSVLYQPAETLTHARMLRVGARLPYPLGPPDVFAIVFSMVARAAGIYTLSLHDSLPD